MDIDGAALGAVEGSVLARLVEKILKQTGKGRRICSPLHRWNWSCRNGSSLLARAQSGLNPERGREVWTS